MPNQVWRSAVIPVIRQATKTIVGVMNIGTIVNFRGTETTYTLPSTKVLPISVWASDGPQNTVDSTGAGQTTFMMAFLLDEPSYKADLQHGYAEFVSINALDSSTTVVAATGLPNLITVTPGSLLDSLSSRSIAWLNDPTNSVAPVVSGTGANGDSLSSTTGTWAVGGINEGITYTYQWNSNGVAVGGATTNSFTPDVTQVGNSITCTVTAHNGPSFASKNSNAIVIT